MDDQTHVSIRTAALRRLINAVAGLLLSNQYTFEELANCHAAAREQGLGYETLEADSQEMSRRRSDILKLEIEFAPLLAECRKLLADADDAGT